MAHNIHTAQFPWSNHSQDSRACTQWRQSIQLGLDIQAPCIQSLLHPMSSPLHFGYPQLLPSQPAHVANHTTNSSFEKALSKQSQTSRAHWICVARAHGLHSKALCGFCAAKATHFQGAPSSERVALPRHGGSTSRAGPRLPEIQP